MTRSARAQSRGLDQLRPITFRIDPNKYAEGSCLVEMGDTQVLVTATIDSVLPGWRRGTGKGWVTAEYAMLPRATDRRNNRESVIGKQRGRSEEIQRLIGRSIRAVTDLTRLGEIQIKLDCDVLQADGGTRCAAINGAFVALARAIQHLVRLGVLSESPLREPLAAVSCGLVDGEPRLDLDYSEDSRAEADANFVLTASGKVVEVQASAEQQAFAPEQLNAMLALAQAAVADIIAAQNKALG